jgi:hypothetical protein
MNKLNCVYGQQESNLKLHSKYESSVTNTPKIARRGCFSLL